MLSLNEWRIINILSKISERAYKKWWIYCMVNHAKEWFHKTLREEVKWSWIQVTGIYPWDVSTKTFMNMEIKDWMRTWWNRLSTNDISNLINFIMNTSSNIDYEKIIIRPIWQE